MLVRQLTIIAESFWYQHKRIISVNFISTNTQHFVIFDDIVVHLLHTCMGCSIVYTTICGCEIQDYIKGYNIIIDRHEQEDF